MNGKLIAFVMLGMVVSSVIFLLLGIYTLDVDVSLRFEGDENILPILFIILTISLIGGGIITGFLSYPLLDTKWRLLWLAPGLYIEILTSFSYLLASLSSLLTSILFLLTSFYFLPLILYYYLVSLAGVGLGYFLRGLIGRIRKSD